MSHDTVNTVESLVTTTVTITISAHGEFGTCTTTLVFLGQFVMSSSIQSVRVACLICKEGPCR